MEKIYDVVGLGELLIDFTMNGQSEQGNNMFEACPGGAICNALAMLSKLGRKTAFIGKVGNEYEVRVYKYKSTDKYSPKLNEYVPRYVETEQYTSFFFYCYFSAIKFVDKDLPYHNEYNNRPIRLLY